MCAIGTATQSLLCVLNKANRRPSARDELISSVAVHVRYFFKGLLVFSYLNKVFNTPGKRSQAFL